MHDEMHGREKNCDFPCPEMSSVWTQRGGNGGTLLKLDVVDELDRLGVAHVERPRTLMPLLLGLLFGQGQRSHVCLKFVWQGFPL